MKNSHFVIGQESPYARKLNDTTVQKKELPPYKGMKKPNADEVTAYQIRFGKAQLGGRNAGITNYVTAGQIS